MVCNGFRNNIRQVLTIAGVAVCCGIGWLLGNYNYGFGKLGNVLFVIGIFIFGLLAYLSYKVKIL